MRKTATAVNQTFPWSYPKPKSCQNVPAHAYPLNKEFLFLFCPELQTLHYCLHCSSLLLSFILLMSPLQGCCCAQTLQSQGRLNHSRLQVLNKNKRLCFTWTASRKGHSENSTQPAFSLFFPIYPQPRPPYSLHLV